MASTPFNHEAARKHYQDVVTARVEVDAATLAKRADALVEQVRWEVQNHINGKGTWAGSSNKVKIIIGEELRKAADVAVARLSSNEFNCPSAVERCHVFRCDCNDDNDDNGCRLCISVTKFWIPPAPAQ